MLRTTIRDNDDDGIESSDEGVDSANPNSLRAPSVRSHVRHLSISSAILTRWTDGRRAISWDSAAARRQQSVDLLVCGEHVRIRCDNRTMPIIICVLHGLRR